MAVGTPEPRPAPPTPRKGTMFEIEDVGVCSSAWTSTSPLTTATD